MPRLNTQGRVTAGIGGGIVSIDNVEITRPGGWASWFDSSSIVYAIQDRVELYSIQTKQFRKVADRGASQVTASGNGSWAAWLGGHGVWTREGRHWPDSWIDSDCMGPDGSLAIRVLYQSRGPWNLVLADGITQVPLTPDDAFDITNLGGGALVWRDRASGGAIRTSGGIPAVGTLPGDFWHLRAFIVNGRVWVIYQSAFARGGLVAHPIDSFRGLLISSGTASYRPDAKQLPNKQVRATWGTRSDEIPNLYEVQDYSLSDVVDLFEMFRSPQPVCGIRYTRGEAGICATCGHAKSLHAQKEPEVPVMNMPKVVYDILSQVHAKFRTMHDGDDKTRSEAMRRGVQTVKAKLAAMNGTGALDPTRWVHKSQHSNLASPSKDGISNVPTGPVVHGQKASMYIYDTVDGTSREMNEYPIEPVDGKLLDQWVIDPPAFDWLADDEPGNGDPTEPDPNDPLIDRVEELEDDVAALTVRMNKIQGQVTELKNRLDTLPTNGGTVDPAAVRAIVRDELNNVAVEMKLIRRSE